MVSLNISEVYDSSMTESAPMESNQPNDESVYEFQVYYKMLLILNINDIFSFSYF